MYRNCNQRCNSPCYVPVYACPPRVFPPDRWLPIAFLVHLHTCCKPSWHCVYVYGLPDYIDATVRFGICVVHRPCISTGGVRGLHISVLFCCGQWDKQYCPL